MLYQELELAGGKRPPTTTAKRCTYQLVINCAFLLAVVGLVVGYVHVYVQLESIRWQLNATHQRIDELQAQLEKNRPNAKHGDIESNYYNDDYFNDDYFTELYSRMKREIVAETTDGVPIETQPYAEVKRRNQTKKVKLHSGSKQTYLNSHLPLGVPVTQAGFHSPAWHPDQKAELKLYDNLEKFVTTPKPVQSRASRVMVTPDDEDGNVEAKLTPKSLPTNGYQFGFYSSDEQHVSTRRRRPLKQRVVESFEDEAVVPAIIKPTRRNLPAAHFSGDTSKYVLGYHTNYKGNGHMKHLDKTYVDWTPSEFLKKTNFMDNAFEYKQGVLSVQESGLYFVYAQIYYLDEHDMNGYRVYRNDESILQCTTMTHSTSRITKGNTCFTAGVEYLSEGDRITVRDLSDERYSLFEKGKSFFGVMKLSDIRIK